MTRRQRRSDRAEGVTRKALEAPKERLERRRIKEVLEIPSTPAFVEEAEERLREIEGVGA